MSPWLKAVILCLSLGFADSELVYRKLGGEVVLPTGSATKVITSITWKHNDDIAVEWFGGEPSSYRNFKGHTALNISTGALTVSGLTRDHSGNYTAEINEQVAGTTEILVISPVPKPTISKQCDPEGNSCNLTCEGNTINAGPVTYSWHIFDAHSIGTDRQFSLTKDNHDPWFQCEMENPVSSESSERFDNPLLPGRNRIFILIPLSAFLILLSGLLVYLKCKSRKGKDIEGGAEEGIQNRDASSNGAVTFLSIQETSDPTPTSSVVPETSREPEMLNTNESSNQGKISKESSDEPEIALQKQEVTHAQVLRGEGTPESSDQTEVQETLVAESSKEAGVSTDDPEDQQTSSHDLRTAASSDTCDEPEKSAEESNGEETTKPLLEDQN